MLDEEIPFTPPMTQVFDGFDLSSFWEDSQYAKENYVDAEPTPEVIGAVEKQLGYKLPAAYIQLARTQNGGFPKNTNHRTNEPTSWSEDHIAITGIYSIGSSKLYSLCGETFNSQFWEEEWGYPAIGVYFADCPSAGHDMIALDYRKCGPEGEPEVVHVDQEDDYRITKVAGSFEDFIRGLESDDAFREDESEIERILRENDLGAIRKLIGSGVDLEVTDEYDRTIIENAAIQNRPEIIQLLAEAGASLRSALEIAEKNLQFFPEHEASVKVLRSLTENNDG
ncbi:SMI1/KNR4 family protein [Persicirhabdus sediminis]|uniref:SMI1/KNR4 family protein n=1 Tax=Persicirhabdus sediminis TaxID=454144 RepID=A0A8J7MBH7_9BACT|nr:SMI1/KNR4 family protein [Persicirhabdus sediminis]MBK1790062.1 SMI1/KNR4 family protein [Persicirhabdus sediminis]